MIASPPPQRGVGIRELSAPGTRRRLDLAAADISAGAADLAVLLRCVIRSEELGRRVPCDLEIPLALAKRAESAFPDAQLTARIVGDIALIRAAEWQPAWLEGSEGVAVDSAMHQRRVVRRNHATAIRAHRPRTRALYLARPARCAACRSLRCAWRHACNRFAYRLWQESLRVPACDAASHERGYRAGR